jgi:hypothetical protein
MTYGAGAWIRAGAAFDARDHGRGSGDCRAIVWMQVWLIYRLD